MVFVRWLLAFAVLFAGAATLGMLDAVEEWPRPLTLASMVPFTLGAFALICPEVLRRRPSR